MNISRIACLVAAVVVSSNAVTASGAGLAEDACDAAPVICGSFVDGDTTAGATDDLNLAAVGACAGGGAQYADTGTGPELFYAFSHPVGCNVFVTLKPETGVDLALYVITDCGAPATSCAGVSDGGGAGATEMVDFIAQAGVSYFIVVDGFGGASGSYQLHVECDDLDDDADGLQNGCDNCPGIANVDQNDADGDGIGDVCDTDQSDADGDGVVDSQDLCPNDANKIAPGVCGCGRNEDDRDGDGLPDCADGCPDDGAKVVPGDCGCGREDKDEDGNGVSDCLGPGEKPDQEPEQGPNSLSPQGDEKDCGSGMGGMMLLPATLFGVGWTRRRADRRKSGWDYQKTA